MSEKFTEQLREKVDPIWKAQKDLPVIKEISQGTLDQEKFKFFLRQRYLLLMDYSRLLALGCARGFEFDTMRGFATLVGYVLQTEMTSHFNYAAAFGISEEELKQTKKAPACEAYCNALLATTVTGDYAELITVILAPLWGHSELGNHLSQGDISQNNPYKKWIDTLSDPSLAGLAQWCRNLLDPLAENFSQPYLDRLESSFLLTSRHDLAFWEMIWTQKDPTV